MDIELVKKRPSNKPCTALKNANVETTMNEKLVSVYKSDLSHLQQINFPAGSCADLLICTNGVANTKGKNITTEEYIFFAPTPKYPLRINKKLLQLALYLN